MRRALRIDYAGPVSKPQGLADGSVRVPAFIARTGVQIYTYDDGSTVREYRPPEEVFSPASLSTWPGLTLTVGHPDEPVTPDNWARLSVGHVADNARKDGIFVAADAVIKDRETLKAIADGALLELSCGYFCELEETAGISPDGEPYDAIQRNIIGNHVAMGPQGWGRAGENVKLYAADSKHSGRVAIGYLADQTSGETAITTNEDQDMTLKKDAVAPAVVAPPATEAAAVEAPKVQEAAVAAPAAVQSPAPAPAQDASASIRIRVAAVKVDAKHATLAGDSTKSDREVMIAVIKDSRASFNSDGKSDEYVRAAFDLACEGGNAAPATRDDSKAATVLAAIATGTAHADADEDPIVKAHKKMKADLQAASQRKGV